METEVFHEQSNEEEEELEQNEEEEELEQDEELGITFSRRHTDENLFSSCHGFHLSADLCVKLIQENMVNRQWEKAASLLGSYFQTIEDRSTTKRMRATEVIWRLGSEILLNHPDSTPDEVSFFHETMKNIGVKKYLQMSLEQVYFLLCNGQTDEAYRILSAAGSWRFGKLSMSQDKLFKLIQAYRALLDHRSWLDRMSAMSQNETDYASQSSGAQDICSYLRQASVAFEEITKIPGVWDPFILRYVELLESSEQTQKAEEVLTNYAYNSKNPSNPNAHVYLYEFMKRNGAPGEKLIEVLNVLYILVPSHKLMLKFSKLLAKSDSEEHHRRALKVLFDLLDFSGWKQDVKAWSYLSKRLKQTLCSDRKAWVSELWEPRSSWWPVYHFKKVHVKKDFRNCATLAIKKASVAGMLQGPACTYFSQVYRFVTEEQMTELNCMKKFLKKHKCGKYR
ncbi:TATA box-binding protein-associated factor RNA polymerase I subunit A [Mixophyes fleayi]|uniref:TATA box-binding protein-associated factor RNA polymerase I subunit A n=1 Tax=Mixophyes fleayi TaxID=3061075 RepID=UPI003F4E393A